MNCRVLLTLTILTTYKDQAAGKLITKPRDTDIKVKQSTYFNCSTDIGSTSIFWFHGTTRVYIGFTVLDPYTGRFTIDKSEWNGTYVYNLVIHSVQSSDAGEYICRDDEGYGETYSVQLIVIADDPMCRSNIELDEVIGQNGCNIEPDHVELECSATYHGNIPPQMEWKKVGENSSISSGVLVVTSGNHFVSTLRLKGDVALNNSSYVCATHRTTQEPPTCTSQVMQIVYVLSDNSTANKTIGDEIHCKANTSQLCSYKWKYLQDNDATIESFTSVLRARKTGWHRCEAECYLRNKTCNLLVMRASIHGEAESTPSSQTTTTIIYVVIAVIVTLIVVGVLIGVIIIWISKRRGVGALREVQNPQNDETVDHIYGPTDVPTEENQLSENEHPENHVIGRNYQFLVENLKSSPLFDLLNEKKCITSEERDHMNNQPDDYFRNDALLGWLRTITFTGKKGQKVLECFHEAGQNLVADLLEKGGDLVKSKISTNLPNESSSNDMEALKENESMIIERLNQPHGLPLFTSGIVTSDIPVDGIFIAPYCHRVADGIVIWFWCESKDVKGNFQSLYEKGILLERLSIIFEGFSNDSVSPQSEVLVPKNIRIVASDFTKNDTIYGLAVLGQEVFVSRLLRPDIEVYDSTTFNFKRRREVKGMNNPEHIVSCSANKCLYAFDWQYQDDRPAIIKIGPADGNVITSWDIEGRGGRLSVASDGNVIQNMNYEARIHEYTAKGDLVRKINLDSVRTEISKAWHAIKLNNGQFIVCHGGENDPLSRVCLLSLKATSSDPGRTDEIEIKETFGAERGELMDPIYLSVDKNGSILVSDKTLKTSVLLNCNLDEKRIIVSEEHGLSLSWRTFFDESTNQWFVSDYQRVMVCKVDGENVERKLFYLISD